jgi:hypothetical protein
LVSKEVEGYGSAASSFYFANGNASHDVIADGFDKAGILVCSEFHLPDVGLNLGGRIDNVIEVDGGYALVEIKTCGTLPTKAKPQNLAQAMVYSLITGIDRIFIFYISRSVASFDGRLKSAEFEVVPSQEDLASTAYRMCVAYFSTLSKKCPPIPPHITARSHCGFCPFQEKCWGDKEFAGVEDMTAREFEKVHTTALEHSERLMRTRAARRIQSVAEFDRMVVKRDEELISKVKEST